MPAFALAKDMQRVCVPVVGFHELAGLGNTKRLPSLRFIKIAICLRWQRGRWNGQLPAFRNVAETFNIRSAENCRRASRK